MKGHRGAFFRLKNMWRANNISLHLKIKLFNACVKLVLLYGCKTWFVTNNIRQKLQAFVNRCLHANHREMETRQGRHMFLMEFSGKVKQSNR
jgi:hypothetical protein